MFTKLSSDQLFDMAQRALEAAPEAAVAVKDDVKDQWGHDIPVEIVNGIMTCGIVYFCTIMQKVAEAKKAREG